jgi:SNF2 family DNA or RNA helicase
VRVWITTYQTFLNDQDELIDRWGCLVCDEVQNVRGRKTKQFPVLRRHARNARRFIGLTGSPLWKTPSDLWTALHLIDAQRWRGFWSFVRQYCHVSWSGFNWHVGGLRAGMAEALMGDVADVCVRRTREDVARQIWGRRGLPTVQVQQQWVKLDLPTRAVYDGLRSNLRTTLPSGKAIVALNFASTTALLEQLTYDWSLLDGRYGDDLLECPKIQACLDIVAKMGSRQFVVYTVVKSALARLKRTLEARKIACALIDGSTDRQGRLQALCDFREGRVRGLLATVLVGGVGITLTSAADIIMLDREWAPEANAQAVDRCVRIGQASRVVRVWLVGADQTIDKRKDAVLAHREVDISAVKEGLAQAWKDRTL